VHIFPGHDHLFVRGGIENLKEKVKKKKKEKKSLNEIPPISPDVLGVISDWIVNKLILHGLHSQLVSKVKSGEDISGVNLYKGR
jgi:hypothetical protein